MNASPTVNDPEAYLYAIARRIAARHPRLANEVEDLVQEGYLAALQCQKPGFEYADARFAMQRAACKALLGVTQGKRPRRVWIAVDVSEWHGSHDPPDDIARDLLRRLWQRSPWRVKAVWVDLIDGWPGRQWERDYLRHELDRLSKEE